MVLGHIEGDQQLYNTAMKDTKAALQFLDKHFEKNTFIAGGKYYSIADAALCSLLF
jgi:glutathione S-transferase